MQSESWLHSASTKKWAVMREWGREGWGRGWGRGGMIHPAVGPRSLSLTRGFDLSSQLVRICLLWFPRVSVWPTQIRTSDIFYWNERNSSEMTTAAFFLRNEDPWWSFVPLPVLSLPPPPAVIAGYSQYKSESQSWLVHTPLLMRRHVIKRQLWRCQHAELLRKKDETKK